MNRSTGPGERLPLEPLLDVMGHPALNELARLLGVGQRQVYRWKTDGGLTVAFADRVAIGIGSHPALIWPEEWAALDTLERTA